MQMPDDIEIQEPTSENLLTCSFVPCTEENVVRCRKCNRTFCVMHSNPFSPNFCKECFKNLAAIESKFERVFEDYDTKTGQVNIHKQTNTRYYMDGMDWPFIGLWIHKLDDDQLRAWWIFHFSVMKLIEMENETRKVERTRKRREDSTKFIGTGQFVTSVHKTRTQTTKVMKTPDTEDVLRAKLKKQGLADNIIDMMVAAMKKGN